MFALESRTTAPMGMSTPIDEIRRCSLTVRIIGVVAIYRQFREMDRSGYTRWHEC